LPKTDEADEILERQACRACKSRDAHFIVFFKGQKVFLQCVSCRVHTRVRADFGGRVR